MNIWIYDNILDGLKEHNKNSSLYGNEVVPYAPKKPTYPLTVFTEVRNVQIPQFRNPFDTVTSNGYRVDIFAKTKGSVDKQKIARKIAQFVNNYLTEYVGLLQTSFNVLTSENDDSIYQITMMYEGTLHNNRAKFI